jgi:hypothetical protein
MEWFHEKGMGHMCPVHSDMFLLVDTNFRFVCGNIMHEWYVYQVCQGDDEKCLLTLAAGIAPKLEDAKEQAEYAYFELLDIWGS